MTTKDPTRDMWTTPGGYQRDVGEFASELGVNAELLPQVLGAAESIEQLAGWLGCTVERLEGWLYGDPQVEAFNAGLRDSLVIAERHDDALVVTVQQRTAPATFLPADTPWDVQGMSVALDLADAARLAHRLLDLVGGIEDDARRAHFRAAVGADRDADS